MLSKANYHLITSLAHHLGRRGAFLLFLAEVDFIYGFSMIFPTQYALTTPTTQFLEGLMPLQAWGMIWTFVGLLCLVYAFRKPDGAGYACAAMLKESWAMAFLLGSITGNVQRGWLTATIWGTFGAVCLLISTWPEQRIEP